MARIRSIHPGLWTDEGFVSMSISSRLFYIGLLNEADDFGLFEWKPMRLKMRLAPADPIDAAELLEEIEGSEFVIRIARGDKVYGVVRNFRKYQRPKKPGSPLVPVDDEIREIIGLVEPPADGELVPHSSPTSSRKSPQMEDGGGNGKMDEKPVGFSPRADARKKPQGWIEPKTPADAANNIIRRIREHELDRIGDGDEGFGKPMLQLPATG